MRFAAFPVAPILAVVLGCSSSGSEPVPTAFDDLADREADACRCFHDALGYGSEDSCRRGYAERHTDGARCLESLADAASGDTAEALSCQRDAERRFVECVESLDCDDAEGFAACEWETLEALDRCPALVSDGGAGHPCEL